MSGGRTTEAARLAHNARVLAFQKTPAGKAKCRRDKLRSRYGITEEQYDFLLEQQDGVCFLCGEDERVPHHANGELMRLGVDHDHECDRGHGPKRACIYCIRSLLCWNCNRMVGRAEHSPRLRARFTDYLVRRPLAPTRSSLL